MALSISTLPGQISASRAEETDGTSTVNAIGSGTLYLDQVSIDNTGNANDPVYLKMYDTGATGSTGSTVPDFIFPCAAGEIIQLSFEPGGRFTNGMQVAVVLEPGTAGTTSPTNNVSYSLLYHA